MTNKLTFEEQYEIKTSFVVEEFSCDYAGCGSHKMELNITADLEALQDLYEKLSKIKGIK